jgi:hypothetical protein
VYELVSSDLYDGVVATTALALNTQGRSGATPEDLMSAEQGEQLSALVEEINACLRFEVDLAHAIALMMRRMVAAQERLGAVGPPRLFATDVALFCALAMAKAADHVLDVRAAARDMPAALARTDAPVTLAATVRTWLRRKDGGADVAADTGQGGPGPRLSLVPATAERVEELRAFIATPLTHVTQAQHDTLMPMARAAAQLLTRWGFRSLLPGESLSPEASDSDDDVAARFAREQKAILGSDLLVVVGCDTDSWGLSKTATWAESSTVPVLMLGSGVQPWCRVLSAGPHRFRHDVVNTPADLDAAIQEAMSQLLVHAVRHAHERTTLTRALTPLLKRARAQAKRTTHPGASQEAALTHARAQHVLSDPALFMGASVLELRAVSAFIDRATLDEMLRVSIAYGAETRGRWTDVAAQRQLGSTQFHALSAARLERGWSPEQVYALLQHYFTVDTPHGRAAQTRFGSVTDWLRLAERLNVDRRRR